MNTRSSKAERKVLDLAVATCTAKYGDAWDAPSRFPALQLLPAATPARSALFLAKKPVYEFMQRYTDGWPDDVIVVERVGLVPHYVYDALHALLDKMITSSRRTLRFIGDLHPHSIIIYSSLRTGGLGTRSEPKFETKWSGVDDEWLALCESTLRDEYRERWAKFGSPVVPYANLDTIGDTELSLIDMPEACWEETVGLRSMAFLRARRWMSIDFACDPQFYDDTFVRKLSALILSRLYT